MSEIELQAAAASGDAGASSAWPRLDARHGAMLAEMGINCWWRETLTPAPLVRPSAAAVPGRPATATPPSAARVPQQEARAVRPVAAAPPPTRSVAAPAASAPVLPRAAIPLAVVPSDQTALMEAIRTCNACELGSRRRHAVPGMGDPAPDWLIVGEAPGEEEDRQGLPFVGRAGQLLDRMLAAMGLSREHQVYIANVIKCRPPQNRNPDPVEIAQCEPYLLRQIELLQPRFILALGRFAAHTLLAHSTQPGAEAFAKLPLGKLRGQVHEVEIAGRRLPLVVSYHPAYLLRSPGEKAKSWADLCLALDAFGRLPPRG